MRGAQPRVLYFTKGPKPTEKEMAMAQSLSGNIGFRFGRGAKSINAEDVDAVAGVGVPPIYQRNGIPYVTTAAQAKAAADRRGSGSMDEFDPDAELDPDQQGGAPAGGAGTDSDPGNNGGNGGQPPNGWGNPPQQ